MQVGVHPDIPRDEFPVRLDIRAYVTAESGFWTARIAGLPDLMAADSTPERAVAAIQRMAQVYFAEAKRQEELIAERLAEDLLNPPEFSVSSKPKKKK